jgi:hypothetical protein
VGPALESLMTCAMQWRSQGFDPGGMTIFLGAPYIFSTVDTRGAVFFGMGARGRRAPCPLAPPLVQCAPGSRDPVHANPESRDWETDPGLQSLAGTIRGIMNELSETHPSGFIKYTRAWI